MSTPSSKKLYGSHPPLANRFTRVVPDSGAVTISGHWIPQAVRNTLSIPCPRSQNSRCLIVANRFFFLDAPDRRHDQPLQYCANTSARNSRDPHTFIPKPVYQQPRLRQRHQKRDILQPFSVGPRDLSREEVSRTYRIPTPDSGYSDSPSFGKFGQADSSALNKHQTHAGSSDLEL